MSGEERMNHLIDVMSSEKHHPKLEHDLHRQLSAVIKHEMKLNNSSITEEVKEINVQSLILVI